MVLLSLLVRFSLLVEIPCIHALLWQFKVRGLFRADTAVQLRCENCVVFVS